MNKPRKSRIRFVAAGMLTACGALATATSFAQASTPTPPQASRQAPITTAQDTATFDPDGTAHITRVVPEPSMVSPEARKWLDSTTHDQHGPQTLEQRRAATDEWRARDSAEALQPTDAAHLPDDAYVGKTDRRDPVLSPAFADLKGMPPTLFVSGTRDSLLGDTSTLHRAMLHAGVDARLVVFEALPHAFWYHFEFPETREALQLTADFLADKVAR